MILVTGGTGLLGGHVLWRLLQEYPRVAALRRPSSENTVIREIFSCYPGDTDSLLARIDWRMGDLLDGQLLAGALEGISCVVNCAAVVSFDPRDRQGMIRNNVDGARNLAEAGIPVIHISSTSALGDGPGNDPRFLTDENTQRDPARKHSGYSESKYQSERILTESGIPIVTLNPGIILGPGQWDKGSSRLFEQARLGITYYPYGGTGYVDVRDVADAVSLMVNHLANNQGMAESTSESGLNRAAIVGQRFCMVGANLRYREFFILVTDEFGMPNPRLYAGKWMTALAWRGEWLRSLFTGKRPQLTRETAESAQRIGYFSSDKIRKTVNFQFRPIEETIAWMADCRKRSVRKDD